MRMVGLMHDESEFKPTSRSTIPGKVNETEPKKARSVTSSPYIDHHRLNLPQDLRSVPFQIPDFRLNLHRARRRRPGRAPRTCSRTPPRSAAPPRDEIPVRNNPVRLAAPSPPARAAHLRRPPRICLCVPPQKRLRNPPRVRLGVPTAAREGATAHAAARAGRRRRPRPGRGRRSPPPGGGASRAPCSA